MRPFIMQIYLNIIIGLTLLINGILDLRTRQTLTAINLCAVILIGLLTWKTKLLLAFLFAVIIAFSNIESHHFGGGDIDAILLLILVDQKIAIQIVFLACVIALCIYPLLKNKKIPFVFCLLISFLIHFFWMSF